MHPNPEFLLMKRDLYERPNHHGYTGIKEYAGRYYEHDAAPDHGVIAIHQDEAPEYTKACFDDVREKHIKDKMDQLSDALAGMLDAFGGYVCPEVDAAITSMQRLGRDRWSMDAQMRLAREETSQDG